MKLVACCVFSVCLNAAAVAQNSRSGSSQQGNVNPQQGTDPLQTPAFLAGRQLNVLCVHHHEAGDAGSTILYRTKEIDADKLKGRIRIGRLTAIVVRFTNVNTFCYDYEAGVTKQVSFYNNSMPTNLKPFFVGGLEPVFAAKGAADNFFKDQIDFKNHYDSYGSLGDLAMDVRKAFADAINPKSDNPEIRKAVTENLKVAFGYTDRDVTSEDLNVRQGELQAGIGLLTTDLAKLRSDTTPGDATAFQTQMGLIAKDEEAVSRLTGQLDNYSTAITDLERVRTAPSEIERVVLLDPKYDEYEVTVEVALLKPKPTESDSNLSPATSSSTIVVDITGSGGIDFSTGIVVTSPVTHDYYIKSTTVGTTTTKTVTNGGAVDPAYDPAVFVTYYIRPGPGQFAIGPTFGVDLNSGQNYFLGLGVIRAGAQRISLVAGLALNKITLLDGDRVGLAPNGMQIQTKQRYVAGYFVGLTFNFGGF